MKKLLITGLIALMACFSVQAKMPVSLKPVASLSAVEKVVAKTIREFRIPRGNPIGGFRSGITPIVGRENPLVGTLGPVVVSSLVEMEKEEKRRKERATQLLCGRSISTAKDVDRTVKGFLVIPDWRLCQMPKRQSHDKIGRIYKTYSLPVKVCCVKDYIMKVPDIK